MTSDFIKIKNFAKSQNYIDEIKREVQEKKAKYFNEIQSQINAKNKLLEEKMRKIKDQQIIQKKLDKDREELTNLIKAKLSKKYQSILEETQKYEKFISDKKSWQMNRENIAKDRNKVFNIIYDEKITYENIFLNETKKTSPFALNNYLSFYTLEFQKLFLKNNLQSEYDANKNITKNILEQQRKTNNYPFVVNEKQNMNYHIINYKESEFDNFNLNSNHINKKELIEKSLDKMDIESNNQPYKNSSIKIILNNETNNEDFEINKSNKSNKNYANSNNNNLIISDDNTKIINYPNCENELIIHEFIKSNFVLPLVNKILENVIYDKKKNVESNLLILNNFIFS